MTAQTLEVQLKVLHAGALGSVYLGSCVLEIPKEEGGSLEGCYPLVVGKPKHAAALARLSAKNGRTADDLGELRVRLWRSPAGMDGLPSSPAKGARRVANRAAGTLLCGYGGDMLSLAEGAGSGALGLLGVSTLSFRTPPGTQPALDTHIHVDVLRARNLLPADPIAGRPPSEWTSDPYVEAQLLPTLHGGGGRAESAYRVAERLAPVWDEQLVLRDAPGSHSVRIRVMDKDLVGADDPLGEVVLPLPPRPPAAGAPGHAAPTLQQGWFPLAAPPGLQTKFKELARLVNPGCDADAPGAFGEVEIRVSWGTAGPPCDDVNLRPALRTRLGTLTLQLERGEGLPAKHPLVHARFEQQTAVSKAAALSGGGVAAFDTQMRFAVTELTSDVALTLTNGETPFGEVILPLQLLTPGAPPKTMWARVHPGRGPGESLLRRRPMPSTSLGALRFTAQLSLDTQPGLRLPAALTPAFGLLAPNVLPAEAVPGIDASAPFSIGALLRLAGRLVDCALAALLSPLRTVLYLQSWQAPLLSASLLALLLLCTLRYWFAARCLTPLWLLLAPSLNGYVSRRIHLRDRAVVWDGQLQEEAQLQSKAAKAAKEARAAAAAHALAVAEEEARLAAEAAAAEGKDPSLAYSLFSQHLGGMAKGAGLAAIPGSGLLSSGVSALGSGMIGAVGAVGSTALDSASVLNIYALVIGKLREVYVRLQPLADAAEAGICLWTWNSPHVSGALTLLLAAAGLAASAALASAWLLLWWAGIGWRHVALLLGLLCLAKPAAPLTRAVLDGVDGALAAAAPLGLASVTAGEGLKCTERPPSKAVLKKTAEDVKTEAKARFEKAKEAKEALRRAKGILRPVTLTPLDWAKGGWLGRAAARGSSVRREAHLRIAAALLSEEKPEVEVGEAGALAAMAGRAMALGGGAWGGAKKSA